MEGEKGEHKNGSRPSYFQRLRKLFQAAWATSAGEMQREMAEARGVKTACRACGAPAVRFQGLSGTEYEVAVADDALMRYFESRDDVDQFVHDRLRRAERIIVELRRENAVLKESRGESR